MASHGAEAARYLFGKDARRPRRLRLGRDARPRRPDDRRGQRGHDHPLRGRPGRDDGRVVVVQGRPRGPLRGRTATPAGSSRTSRRRPLRAFIERPAGYLGEKTDADTGLGLPGPGRDLRPRARRDDAPTSSRRSGTADAARDVPRRVHRERDHRRRLPIDATAVAGSRSSAAGAPWRHDDDDATTRTLPWLDEAIRPARAPGARPRPMPWRQASQWCAEAIAADGLVHLFGTGHSRIPVEEMFPRYGSYPGFNPIVELSMTFHTQVVGANGQRQAMFIERMPRPGRGHPRPTSAFGPHDVMIVFSAGGTTAVPVEMARGARAARAAGHRGHVGRAVDVRATRPGRSAAASSTRRTSSSTCAPRSRCGRHRSTASTRRSARHRRSPPSPSSTPSRCAPPSCSSSAERCHRSSPGPRS